MVTENCTCGRRGRHTKEDHSRWGKIGVSKQPHWAKVLGGRLVSHETQVRAGKAGSHEDKVRAGILGGAIRKAEMTHENWQELGRKGGSIGGRKNADSGLLARNNREMVTKRPTHPERIFYGLVLGDSITAFGFSAQQSDGHGIYDGAWRKKQIIAELDGSGHHAFRDRHAEDTQKDIARMLEYNTVLRETDENVLYLKVLAIFESEL